MSYIVKNMLIPFIIGFVIMYLLGAMVAKAHNGYPQEYC